MIDPDDRFGMPKSAFQAARKSHGLDSPVLRLGMDVPSRREVFNLPAGELFSILIDWMWESPSELIPNNKQIAEVRALMMERPDASEADVQRLVAECDAYLNV